MDDLITRCCKDIQSKVQLIAGDPIKDENVLLVVSQADFEDKTKLLTPPFAGVLYVGLRATAGDPSRQGLATDLVVAILFGFSAIAKHQSQDDAWPMLCKARKAIRTTPSPTNHKWAFRSEAYVMSIKNIAFYTQTWGTMAPLTLD